MKITGVIPSRYSSSRFPGKPLVQIAGKSMIRRVYEQAKASSALSDVVVATDDERIYNHVKDFGGSVVMTSSHHSTGTERCAEVLENQSFDADVVINIQGDEPFINPSQIDILCECFKNETVQIASLAKKITDFSELKSEHVVKVVMDIFGNALYFSRYPIPFLRATEFNENAAPNFYKHVGLYAYRNETLREIVKLKPSELELAESLEQLRWLENGKKIKMLITEFDSIGIDTPDDLLKIGKNFSLE